MLIDVADAKETAAYVNATVARWGPIDVLFSNAGVGGAIGPVTDISVEAFDYTMDVLAKSVIDRARQQIQPHRRHRIQRSRIPHSCCQTDSANNLPPESNSCTRCEIS